jgi:hypothetical protein
MTVPPDLAARHAWRGALVAAALNAVGMPLDFVLAREVPNMPFYPSALSALVGVCLIVVLWTRRRRATVRLGSSIFLLNTLVMLAALWITSGYWASTRAWTPLAFERDVLRLQAEAAAAERVARDFLRLRDYANTPIQTVVFATELMRVRNPDLEPILARVDRATKRLMELSRALKSYEVMRDWNPTGECRRSGESAIKARELWK